jgi:hypothetical protein
MKRFKGADDRERERERERPVLADPNKQTNKLRGP